MIGISSIVRCFDETCVGTKVTNREAFMTALEQALKRHDSKKDEQPGQHCIDLPGTEGFLSGGVGHHTSLSEDYVVRFWRRELNHYLRREKAEPVTGALVVVYNREAFGKDPEVNGAAFAEAFPTEDVTHCIVAILGFAGPKSPVSPIRFTMNLAGANNEYDILARRNEHMREISGPKGEFPGMFLDSKNGLKEQIRFLEQEIERIQKLAGEVTEYSRTWCVVAD